MAKDPAVLFYTADFLVGVSGLTMEERGQYITLLCLQHQKGHLSDKDILINVGKISEDVLAKFEVDEEGKRYNARMDDTALKRNQYIDSRRLNGSKGGRPKKHMGNHMEKHMGNHSENENINENINIVISYMNNKLGTKYKHTSEYIRKYIKARLGEGFTPEDFYTVIDKKIHEWTGTKMEKFLRPETLFGTKFQQYLNQIGGRDEDYEKSNAPPPTPTKIRHGDFDPNKALERALERSFEIPYISED